MNDIEEALAHVGVLGMKWGRRKGRTSSSKKSDDAKKVSALKKKNVSELSDEEIRKVINRKTLEKQYSELNATRLQRGRKMLNDAVSQAGKNAIQNVAQEMMVKALKDGIQSVVTQKKP